MFGGENPKHGGREVGLERPNEMRPFGAEHQIQCYRLNHCSLARTLITAEISLSSAVVPGASVMHRRNRRQNIQISSAARRYDLLDERDVI